MGEGTQERFRTLTGPLPVYPTSSPCRCLRLSRWLETVCPWAALPCRRRRVGRTCPASGPSSCWQWTTRNRLSTPLTVSTVRFCAHSCLSAVVLASVSKLSAVVLAMVSCLWVLAFVSCLSVVVLASVSWLSVGTGFCLLAVCWYNQETDGLSVGTGFNLLFVCSRFGSGFLFVGIGFGIVFVCGYRFQSHGCLWVLSFVSFLSLGNGFCFVISVGTYWLLFFWLSVGTSFCIVIFCGYWL